MDEQAEVEFVSVRGVMVPKVEIENMEAEFGASLVPDSEVLIIQALDTALRSHRMSKGIDPDVVNLREDPFHWYKHANLNIIEPITGTAVSARHKPAWFRFPRHFVVGRTPWQRNKTH